MMILRSLATLPAFLTLALVTSSAHAAENIAVTPSTVVAKQGSAIVTMGDVDAFAERMPARERPGFFNSPTRIETMIQNLLQQKQLAAEAREAGLEKEPLVKSQLLIADDEVLSRVRLQRFRAEMKLPDFGALAKEDYIANKEKYVAPGKLTVEHVLISSKSRSEDEARQLAETVRKEAVAHPDQFEALVDKYSDDMSKTTDHGKVNNAGDATRYVPEFAAAAKALNKPNEISPIVKTQFGFHVMKLIERSADGTRSFADVKDEIVTRLRAEYIDKEVKTHVDTLRNLPLDANPDIVGALRTRYGPPPTPNAPKP
jgi:peptidyl-prolyl cis-trans isomerase C